MNPLDALVYDLFVQNQYVFLPMLVIPLLVGFIGRRVLYSADNDISDIPGFILFIFSLFVFAIPQIILYAGGAYSYPAFVIGVIIGAGISEMSFILCFSRNDGFENCLLAGVTLVLLFYPIYLGLYTYAIWALGLIGVTYIASALPGGVLVFLLKQYVYDGEIPKLFKIFV